MNTNGRSGAGTAKRSAQTLWHQHGQRALLIGAALALAGCLLNPRWPWPQARVEQVVVIDITQSMNVVDQRLQGKPASRLAFAKNALRSSLLALPCGSKLGWAVFTEYRSFLLLAPVEVCAHLDELRSTLAAVDNRMAWVGASEIAKGLHSGLAIAKLLPDHPALVFVTDGQESPPLNPRHRPAFDDRPGAVAGLVVGVGGLIPLPIPKTDPDGLARGTWGADEVLQTDPRSLGLVGGVQVGQAVEAANDGAAADPAGRAALGAVPGQEHLSSLREGYLRLLAAEAGLGYMTLDSAEALAQALTAAALTHPVTGQADGRVALALLALALLLLRHLHLPTAWRAAPAAPPAPRP
ncbi:MAG: MxaL protein [Rubrivivax sp.]